MNRSNLKEIFDSVTFLRLLLNYKNLVFVGDRATLESIRRLYSNKWYLAYNNILSRYPLFIDITDFPKQYLSIKEKKVVIIVASIKRENEGYAFVEEIIRKNNAKHRVLKLVGDIYVNHFCRRDLLESWDNWNARPSKKYAVVCTPRSGSNYLCELLEKTGKAGFPREYLNGTTERLMKEMEFTPLDYLNKLSGTAITPNNVFGIKMISHYLKSHYEKEDLSNFFKDFKFIYLYRKNKLEQAVSLYLAKETSLWHLQNSSKLESYQSAISERFLDGRIDYDKILAFQRFIIEQDKWLESLLTSYSGFIYRLDYEELAKDPDIHIKKILDFLEITLPFDYQMGHINNIKLKTTLSDMIIKQLEKINNQM